MKVLSSFLLPIPLDGKRGRNRGALDKKTSSKAAFVILPLHNSSDDALLLFSFHPLIVHLVFIFLRPNWACVSLAKTMHENAGGMT